MSHLPEIQRANYRIAQSNVLTFVPRRHRRISIGSIAYPVGEAAAIGLLMLAIAVVAAICCGA